MAQYVLIISMAAAVVIALYLAYQRYSDAISKSDSPAYVEALQDLLDGREQAAFTKLRQVVSEDSKNIDAYLRLGRILREHKKPDRALQVHKDLTLRSDLSSVEKAGILRELLLDYKALKDLASAQAAVKEMLAINSRDSWAQAAMLDLYSEAGQWDEAYEASTKLLKMQSNKSKKPLAPLKYRMGDTMLKKREYHKARILFKEALGLDPTYVPAYLAIGDSYSTEDRHEDAVNIWKKLIETNPDQGHQVIDRLKKALFDLGRYGDVGEICESILQHSPRNLHARYALALFHEKKGDAETAERILIDIVDESPEDMKAALALIRSYLDNNQSAKATRLVHDLEQRRARETAARGAASASRPVGAK